MAVVKVSDLNLYYKRKETTREFQIQYTNITHYMIY